MHSFWDTSISKEKCSGMHSKWNFSWVENNGWKTEISTWNITSDWIPKTKATIQTGNFRDLAKTR